MIARTDVLNAEIAVPPPAGWRRTGPTGCTHDSGAQVWWRRFSWCYQRARTGREPHDYDPDGYAMSRDEAMQHALEVTPCS